MMKDEYFINQVIQKGGQAREKVLLSFSNLSIEQLNWKSSSKSWSIAQCLEHLIKSHSAYFVALENIIRGKYVTSFWEKHSPFTRAWGQFFKKRLREEVGTKMKAPGKIRPATSHMGISVIQDYVQTLDKFLDYISNCAQADLDKTVIVSPIFSIVTYTLRDAFTFLIQHEHRHINQAIRVKTNEDFPK